MGFWSTFFIIFLVAIIFIGLIILGAWISYHNGKFTYTNAGYRRSPIYVNLAR